MASLGRRGTLALGAVALAGWLAVATWNASYLYFASLESAWISVLGQPALVFGGAIVGGELVRLTRRRWLAEPPSAGRQTKS